MTVGVPQFGHVRHVLAAAVAVMLAAGGRVSTPAPAEAAHAAPGGSRTTPAQSRLTLVGAGFKLYATKSPGSGKARVYVDGVLKATINLNAASTADKSLGVPHDVCARPARHPDRGGRYELRATSAVHLDPVTIDGALPGRRHRNRPPAATPRRASYCPDRAYHPANDADPGRPSGRRRRRCSTTTSTAGCGPRP